MANGVTIPKDPPAIPSLNYALIREEGIQHIQELAGNIWTDFNFHDSGVNTLEVLCYAITDLGFRTNRNIADILPYRNETPSDTDRNFFTSGEILPSNPVTINDFRKILLDHSKIKNAWLETGGEPEQNVLYNEATKSLSFTIGELFPLSGLYKVLLEFEEDVLLGNLNSSIFNTLLTYTSGSTTLVVEIDIAMPFWDEMPATWNTSLSFENIVILDIPGSPGEKLMPITTGSLDDYFAEIEVTYNGGQVFKFGARIRVLDEDTGNEADLKNAITDYIQLTAAQILLDPTLLDTSLMKLFNNKIIAANAIIQDAKKVLAQKRNVCEDFVSFKASRVQEIAVSGQIELYNEAAVEKILGRIFYEIEVFLTPNIRFYSISEMLEKGYTIEEVLSGPLLSNGFIEDKDLITSRRRDIIYTSDLVNLIMTLDADEISGMSNRIIAVSDLSVSNFINNQQLGFAVKNCLELSSPELYKPKLSVSKSSLIVFRKGIEIAYDVQKVIDEYELLLAATVNPLTTPGLEVLDVPDGTEQELETYSSIQYDFPSLYGLGDNSIPGLGTGDVMTEEEKKLRTAQVLQFKGYLFFFDQVLANYLSQLAHIRDLFSADPYQASSYFFQPLYDVPGADELLKSFTSGGVSWNNFINNPDNDYINALKTYLLSDTDFTDRRNRFLDHLIARFSESFIDYALFMKSQPNGDRLLIDDKSAFLTDYPVISSDRAKSFDYFKTSAGLPDVWFSDNVTGYEKRLCRLLGIKSYRRRFLFNDPAAFTTITEFVPGSFRIDVQDDTATTILSSITYPSLIDAQNAVQETLLAGMHRANYRFFYDSATGVHSAQLFDAANTSIATVPGTFTNPGDMHNIIDSTQSFLYEKYSGEGIYVVEHILLRPKRKDVPKPPSSIISDAFLPADINENGITDPYTFRISVIFPSGYSDAPSAEMLPERFSTNDFRTLAERTIYRETPAHILPDIYWVNQELLMEFEDAFKLWLERNASATATLIELTEAQMDLVDKLTAIANVS